MDGTTIEIMPVSTVEAITRGEVDMQVSTAKRYPRDIEASRSAAIAMACKDQATAAECMYALPRAGKKIEGGSIRLAEIVSSTYGNLRVQARIIDDATDRKNVTAMASAWDLESNTAVSIEKKRRATYSNGNRFNDDMIITTQNANVSIAFRDAVFKVVPRAYWQPIYDAAKDLAIGDASTLVDRRAKLIQHFGKMGVFEDRLLANLGYSAAAQITLDDIEKLLGTANLIREGQTTVDEAFPPIEPDKKSSTLGDRMAAKTTARKKKESEPVPEDTSDPNGPPGDAEAEPVAEPPPPDNAKLEAKQEAANLVKEIQSLGRKLGQQDKIDVLQKHGIAMVSVATDLDKLKAVVLDLAEIADAPAEK